MLVGALTGGIALAFSVANRTLSFNVSAYEIYPLVVTLAGVIGGLAPDIDMRQSKAGSFLRKILRMSLVVSAIFLLAMVFVPQTGIEFLDGAIATGARMDRGFPSVLAAFCIFVLVVIEKSKHRGFTHTIVGLLVIAAPLVFMLITGVIFVGANIAVSAQIGFVLGWLSHMIIDSFNSPGIPWLWPVLNKRFRIMRIRCGSKDEATFVAMCTVLFIACYALIII